MQIRHQLDINKLSSETENVIARLDYEEERTLSPNKLTYETSRIEEMYDISILHNDMPSRGLTDMVSHAIEVSNYSRELRTLLEQERVTQAAAFLAISIMNNPFRRYDEDEIYYRSMNLMSRLDPSASETDIEFGRERQGKTWTENKDWYEMLDRNR